MRIILWGIALVALTLWLALVVAATWVMPEATHNPGPTNTPVPGARPAAWLALTAEARAVGVAAWGGAPWRVWIVAVGR